MKPNEIKIKLIKIEGTNILYGKGIWNTEKTLCTEKTGKIRKSLARYQVNAEHIKRSQKGKAMIFIDLNTHKSFNPYMQPKDIKTINQIQYVTQAANWEAHQSKMKVSKWAIIGYMLAGMGVLAILLTVLGVFR